MNAAYTVRCARARAEREHAQVSLDHGDHVVTVDRRGGAWRYELSLRATGAIVGAHLTQRAAIVLLAAADAARVDARAEKRAAEFDAAYVHAAYAECLS